MVSRFVISSSGKIWLISYSRLWGFFSSNCLSLRLIEIRNGLQPDKRLIGDRGEELDSTELFLRMFRRLILESTFFGAGLSGGSLELLSVVGWKRLKYLSSMLPFLSSDEYLHAGCAIGSSPYELGSGLMTS